MSQLKLDLSYHFDGIKARSRAIQGVITAAKSAEENPIEYADPLTADLFNICYQQHPRIMRTNRPNDYNKILRAVAASDSFKEIKKDTQSSLVWSSIGAAVMLDEIQKSQSKPPQGYYPQESDGDDSDGDNGQSGSGDVKTDQQIERAISNAKERLDDLKDGLGGKSAGRGNSIPTFADAAIETEQLTHLLANRQLAKLLKKIGRLRTHQSFLPALDVLDAAEVTDVNVGRNLANVLPQDLSLLTGTEEEFRIFTEKYNNSELLQFKTKAATKSGEGPLIVCIDCSGSMGEIDEENSPLSWAASVAAASYITSLKKRRPFAIVYFSDGAIRREPKKQGSFDAEFLKAILSPGYGGGTHFQAAWDEVIAMMKKGTNTWRKADVLFITDGDGYIKTDWSKDKAKYSTRLFSFFIGRNRQMMQRSELAKKLGEYSDMMSFMEKLNKANAQIINEVIGKSKKQK